MLLDTPFDPLNSFRATFLLKGLLIYLIATSLTVGSLNISKSSTAWFIRQLPDWNQAAAWIIRWLPDWNQALPDCCQIKIRQLPDQSGPWFVRSLALTNLWTVGHSTVQPLDSLTQHSPTIGQLDTTLTNNRTVGHITDQPLDSETHHWPTIGLLDTALLFVLFWTILGHFWCSIVTLVIFTSNLNKIRDYFNFFL